MRLDMKAASKGLDIQYSICTARLLYGGFVIPHTYILSSRALYWVQLKKSVYCYPDFVSFRIQTTAAGVALDAGYLDIGFGYTFRIPAV